MHICVLFLESGKAHERVINGADAAGHVLKDLEMLMDRKLRKYYNNNAGNS